MRCVPQLAKIRRHIAAAVILSLVISLVPGLPNALGLPSQTAFALVGTTTRVSVSSSGAQGNAESRGSSIAPDAQVIAFFSSASNLVAGDTNAVADVFVYDAATAQTTRVSVGPGGVQANGASIASSLSGDGRYVAFDSAATNLIADDTNAKSDVFLYDRSTTTVERISVTSSGGQASADSFSPDITPDGRFVAFLSYADFDSGGSATGQVSVYLRDRQLGTTTLVASNHSLSPSVSDDGRYVAFSTDSPIVPGDTNGQSDVFVRDMATGVTTRVSVASDGTQANSASERGAISGDGRYVAFESYASNLVAGDTNGSIDVFLHDMMTGTTSRVSVSSSGAQGDNNSTPRDHDGAGRFISRGGRFVAFRSSATNFGGPSGALYARDTQLGTTTVLSAATDGTEGTGLNGVVSANGRYFAFESSSSTLVPGDTNAVRDVFLRDTQLVFGDYGSDKAYALALDPNGAYSPDPVNLATGNFVAHADDLSLAGRVLPFSFTRWYNSADATPAGPLGPAWTHSYNWTAVDGGTSVEIRRGDGRRDAFTRNPDGTYADPPNVFDVLVKNGDGSFTLTLVNQMQYELSGSGQLTRIHEPAGNQITLIYTGANLTTITDTVGRQVALTYDGSNRLVQIQDPLSRKVTYAYDASGRLSTVTDKIGNAAGQDPAQHRWTYGYDGTTRHITTVTDPDGRVRVTNTYDSQGRVTQQRDGLSALTQMSYGAGQTVLTDPRLHATTYTFDSRIRVLGQSDGVGANIYSISYAYDTAGNRTAVTDRNGKTTDFTYDARGNVLTKTDPQVDPQTPRYLTQLAYDAKNNLTQVTDARGLQTTMTYDAATNVLLSVSRQIDVSTSAVTKYVYGDPANPGLPTQVVAPRGNTGPTPDTTYATLLAYDSRGDLETRVDPDAAETSYGYDLVGRLTSFIDPDGFAPGANPAEHTWTVQYDENDRETRRTDPLGNALAYGYDGAGNRTSLTDRRGNVTAYSYDANTRLATVQQRPDPVSQPTLVYLTQVVRDASGNATRILQANGVATEYAFDELDRLTSVTTHPDAQTNLTTGYVLDGNGQPMTRTTGDGVTVTYGHDALSRLTSVAAPGLTTITYAYDDVGHRTRMVDGTGTTTYQYDGLGRVLFVNAPNGTLSYVYDLDGNRTTLGYPGSQNVSYAYSPGGRLSTVTDWASRVSSYTYQPSGLVSTLTYPNTMHANYVYDRAQRLTQITNAVGATTITQHTYTLDAEGNRTALDEYVQGLTPPVLTWSASVQVNDVATGQQDRPEIALGADAASYLIWDDYRAGSNGDIYFSRRDPGAGTWSANQKVNNDTGTRTQWNPSIAMDGSNNAYAVWSDQRDGNKTPDTNVYFSKRSAATGVWSANVRVNNDTQGSAAQATPRIAVRSAGDAVSVWEDHRSNQWNVHSSRLPAGSSTWAANLRVTDNTVSRKFTPDVAVGADGTAYAVWEDDRLGNSDIWFSKLPAGASAWNANQKISDDPGTAAQYAPRIGIDGAGNLIVVWLDDRGTTTQVRMTRLLAGSQGWDASRVASDAAAVPVALALGVSNGGSAFAVWQDARGTSYDIWGADYDAATNAWSTPSLVSDDPGSTAQMRPTVARNVTEVATAWRDDRIAGGDVRARRRAAGGTGIDHFTFVYDGLNRLTTVTGPFPESFTFDAATNITSRAGPAATYSYDGSNRLTSVDSQPYGWDGADRLRSGPGELTYDALGRLTFSSRSSVPGFSVEFKYDGDGLLSSRIDGVLSPQGPQTPAEPKPFLWDVVTSPSRLVAAGSNRVVHGLGPLYGVRGDTTTYNVALDGLGSVRAELADDHFLSNSFRYAAYGTVAQSYGATVNGAPTLLGFAGELVDSIGLVYLRARWYDPGTGRFTRSDPYPGAMFAPVSLNGFPYAQGRPTLLTDPLGLDPSGSTSRSNWAYDIANVFRDLDSPDRGTQLAALAKITAIGIAIAIPIGIATAPAAVGVAGSASAAIPGVVGAVAPRLIAYAAGGRIAINLTHVVGRHIPPQSLQAVTQAVEEDVNAVLLSNPSALQWIGWVQVGGQWLQYRAYQMGTYVNIGAVFPVAGQLSNLR